MTKEFLLEIGTEEIPSSFIPKVLKDMEKLLEKDLKNLRIDFEQIQTFGTPRRLVLYIEDLADRQKDTCVEIKGPSKKAAFDDKGNPTKAAIGFAKAQGIDLDDVQYVSTPRGEYLAIKRKESGNDTKKILPSVLPEFLHSIPFPKSMRWGESSLRFARPIHWILCLLDGESIPFCLDGIESKNLSFGHRFMKPAPFKVENFNQYISTLREAYVIVDPLERKKIITEAISHNALKLSVKAIEDKELLEEVAYLVEYPTAVVGRFENEFLNLPREVLIASMREHQMYFSVVDESDNLMPFFITINNTVVREPEVVIKGNERVLKARLSDARFFFEEDQKIPLWERIPSLKEVLFQSELGTLHEKVMRLKTTATYLTTKVDPGLKEATQRASLLCKADLTCGMVGEFPKLQGVMGRKYALLSGEDEDVATAIYEHYLPRFAGDALPSTHIGAFISIADKLDTMVGCFGVGLIPTGTSDPYALRRQALGIIHIILDKKYPVSLKQLLEKTLENLNEKLSRDPAQVQAEVLEFFRLRFQHQLIAQGYSYDVIDAVLSLRFDDLVDSFERIKALQELKRQPDFTPLTIAYKRASNILSQSAPGKEVDVSFFEYAEENILFEACKEVRKYITKFVLKKEYREALFQMVQLREPVDRFFENVMVIVEDENIRKNRLALLYQVSGIFLEIADLSKIVTE